MNILGTAWDVFLVAAYLASLLGLFCYGVNCYVLMALHRKGRKAWEVKAMSVTEAFWGLSPSARRLPSVTVQLPIYNEQHVVERLIDSVAALDYPRRLLEVQVLDDSTDETTAIVAELVARHRSQGLDIHHVRRTDRVGYKAGALREGLRSAEGELIAVFDADFTVPKDFLMRTVPFFDEPRVGMVQTRWGHINRDYSFLTRAQAIGIDGHFGVEQGARAWSGLLLNFNGTAGLWRRAAIDDAGGWLERTLTEDLDLSYRAQLKGWKMVYLPDVVCPAELPVQLHGFKTQQRRWAKGSIQTAKHLLPELWRSPLPLFTKAQASLHLTHYLVHPLMLSVVVLSLPLLMRGFYFSAWTPLLLTATLLALATFGPSSLYLYALDQFGPEGRGRWRYLPVLVCLGTGIALSNTKAVAEALVGHTSGFVRTPKFKVERRDDTWAGKHYAAFLDRMTAIELLLAGYSLLALVLFVVHMKIFIWPFMAIYTAGFFFVALLGLKQRKEQLAAARTVGGPKEARRDEEEDEPSGALAGSVSFRAEETS
jgi:cellulose synthase/poly-beta-1,6-N-acetylglucosamine synthase-like glycosyltransferase